MPPAAATLPPPTATLPARSVDDLAPAYSDSFDSDDSDDSDTEPGGVADRDRDDEPESEPVEVASTTRSPGLGFPSTSDVPEPRTADDDEAERPSPIARPDRTGRLTARISARR
jgi:hypothetical protein